jgi:hypothetical protein
MIRQIITPLRSSFTLQFPEDMLGKTVEIIAFELNGASGQSVTNMGDKVNRLKRISDITKRSLTDLSKFKFNRNDANDQSE